MNLTPDQETALRRLTTWLYSDSSQYYTLTGYAGTGKTTMLSFLLKSLSEELSYTVTATTNKAVKVLRERLSADCEYSTIHSLLKIKAQRRGTREIFEPSKHEDSPITSFDLVIIDEASMISRELLDWITDYLDGSNTRVLFVGDPVQLPPVGELVSPVFTDYPLVSLTTVIRHNDSLSQAASLLRGQSTTPTIHKLKCPEITIITQAQAKSFFKDFNSQPNGIRMLCWTNSAVLRWNRTLRAVTGVGHTRPFEPGEWVIAQEPCIRQPQGFDSELTLLANSEEAQVISVEEKSRYWKVRIKRDNGQKPTLKILKDNEQHWYKSRLRELANEKHWKEFWRLKKSYHNIRHLFALTSHKSQGSTFEQVIIDWRDITQNRDLAELNQLLYVAITRASSHVHILF